MSFHILDNHWASMIRSHSMLGLLIAIASVVISPACADEPAPLTYTVERTQAHSGFDGQTCWVHARAGAIPAGVSGNDADTPLVVMTMQKLLLTGSDVFYRLHGTLSSDDGESWTTPKPYDSFARQIVGDDPATLPTGASIAPQLVQPGDETTVCDFAPQWHAASQRLLGIGQTVWYHENRVMHVRPRGIAYAVYDAPKGQWLPWKTVRLPSEPRFQDAGSGSVQRVDLPGGDVLVPFYCKVPTEKQYSTVVCRCRFDGQTLHYVEHGEPLTVPVKRGLYEPSLTQFKGRFYLTMRNDDHAYVSTSDDGLNFDTPRRWTFDDGSDLGSYNTQQHWVTHSDGLFLVYTRRGANNDHVMRHRAPLFMAQVNPETLQVQRESETVLVPQRGARLGNFGVVDVSPDETWVTAAEWMQPSGVSRHGSDNSVFIAKLRWNRPNESLAASTQHSPISPDRGATLDAKLQPYSMPPAGLRDDLGEYRSPLQFADGSVAKTHQDWQRRRSEILEDWQRLLGEWPPLVSDAKLEILDSQRRENFTQHRVRFQWMPDQQTIGYLLVPAGSGPHPAVVTVFYEPETAIGLGKPERDFALQLARRGFVTLSIGTTEASLNKTYSLYYPSIDDATVEPLSMLAYAAANAWHALAGRPEVDQQRIGIVGHSFGGKWAMFAACLFDRFACAAWSDPGIVFDANRPSVNYWEPWYLGYHPRPWRRRGLVTAENPAQGLYPQLISSGRDLHELHALMAPRPFLVSGGSEDPIERWKALNHSVAVNRLLGNEGRVLMTNRPDHSPNPDSNAMIYAFLQHHLAGPSRTP
ncbi:S9 family peptidase [Stieleria sp. TO1_6]|uniref:S9 family peptidase n=1 Tax=Stieleria tagensis TaxID=2956795 RepID=UPI00209B50FE|nr:S9 family peptidase [Stieleria tagensis]MCO8124482.1 S9 family peptidase [Stieleria tagensis]